MRSTVKLGAGAALLVLLACMSGCAPGTRATSTAPLDFGDKANWAALPWTSDDADRTPSPEQRDLQEQAPADAFFIHPTTYLSLFGRNATTDDSNLNRWTDVGPIRLQASAFNACCRVFAPRYRQAAIGAFVGGLDKADPALDFAYQDVRGRMGSESILVTGTAAGMGRLIELRNGSAGTVIDGFTFGDSARGIQSTGGPIDNLQILNNRFVGATGAGKGSVLWSLIHGLSPAIREGWVQVWALDP